MQTRTRARKHLDDQTGEVGGATMLPVNSDAPHVSPTAPLTDSSSDAAAPNRPSPAPGDVESPAAPIKQWPWWQTHRRMYEWVLSLAHHKHSTTALFVLSFAESSFFPIPPDVLQIMLTMERRSRAWYYAAVSLAGSVLGGVLGYLIGWGLWEAVQGVFYRYVFSESAFASVQLLYQKWDFWAVFFAAFTPIPYKVFTIAAGVFSISLPMFILGSIIGRGGRFFAVAALLWWFGPPVKRFIEKYFNWLTLAFGVLLVGAFAALKMLH